LEKIDTGNIKMKSRIKIKEEINQRWNNDNSNKIATYELNSPYRSNNSNEVAALRNKLNSSRKQIHILKTIIDQLQMIIKRLIKENYI